MSDPARKYWFPAKRYGWGWGPPCRWEGWVFLVVWIAVVLVCTPLVKGHPGLYALFMAAMIAVMLGVCSAKGEPPRWRWGDRGRPPGD
jgi:hypothetical protein